MGIDSKIEWTDATWTPVRARVKADASEIARAKGYASLVQIAEKMAGHVGPHCEHASDGCKNCYSETSNGRCLPANGTGLPFDRRSRDLVDIHLDEKILTQPLRWKTPRRIFVNSQTDTFGEFVPDGLIDRIFAVMALCPQHTFQVLTKRAERMGEYFSDSATPFRIAKEMDRVSVRLEIALTKEEIRPIIGYPGYFASNLGIIFSSNGSSTCPYCGSAVDGPANKMYCRKKCRQNAGYLQRTGRDLPHQKSLTIMTPDTGQQGHCRVMLYRNGEPFRELVHRVILSTFQRLPEDGEQGCHRDGDASNNHIANLRWGDQENNWEDRKRHGNGKSWSFLVEEQVLDIRALYASGETAQAIARRFCISDTQVYNIVRDRQHSIAAPISWPIEHLWVGVSVEDQETADARIPSLLRTDASVRFISYEPALGPIDLTTLSSGTLNALDGIDFDQLSGPRVAALDWVISGGESGPGARPSHPDWHRGLRDQCESAGVPFLFKQWGEWRSRESSDSDSQPQIRLTDTGENGQDLASGGDSHVWMQRVGKKAAGRLLDGREWNGFPDAARGVR